MKYIFVDESWEDYLYWQKTDRKKLKRINALLKDIARHPYTGLGKPEPLKYKYAGFWSRRIDKEHRLIYMTREVGAPRLQLLVSIARVKPTTNNLPVSSRAYRLPPQTPAHENQQLTTSQLHPTNIANPHEPPPMRTNNRRGVSPD